MFYQSINVKKYSMEYQYLNCVPRPKQKYLIATFKRDHLQVNGIFLENGFNLIFKRLNFDHFHVSVIDNPNMSPFQPFPKMVIGISRNQSFCKDKG